MGRRSGLEAVTERFNDQIEDVRGMLAGSGLVQSSERDYRRTKLWALADTHRYYAAARYDPGVDAEIDNDDGGMDIY